MPLSNSLPLSAGRKRDPASRLLLWSVFCVLLLLAGAARAGSAKTGSVADLDADNGLAEAHLGTPLANMPGLRKTEDVGRWLTYDRPTDKLNFLGVEVKSITYNFFKERLYSIDLELQGRHNVGTMLKMLEQRYGKIHTLDTKTYQHTNAQLEVREWAGAKVYCEYKSAADRTAAELVLLDKPTWDLLQVPKEERAAMSREMLKGSYTNGDF
jgi:hypothetical protein